MVINCTIVPIGDRSGHTLYNVLQNIMNLFSLFVALEAQSAVSTTIQSVFHFNGEHSLYERL